MSLERVRGVGALVLGLSAVVPLSAQAERVGIWITPEEIQDLPMEGLAWEGLVSSAEKPLPRADISDRNSNCDVLLIAKCLVDLRKGESRYTQEIQGALSDVMGSERRGDVLSLGRNLPGYVIAADLVGLPEKVDKLFRAWLRSLLDQELVGMTLRHVHEVRPNNWGTHAGAARVVIARYLRDDEELERAARVFRGWLGERSVYDGFHFGDRDWQSDPARPVGINPRGAQRDGHSLDGVLPDDQRRSGAFTWPPPKENYVYEALQGALVQAVVLHRAGYEDCWSWGDRALLRASVWLDRDADYPAEGDDTWQPHVINHYYGWNLRSLTPSRPGKNMGWTDWTLTTNRKRVLR